MLAGFKDWNDEGLVDGRLTDEALEAAGPLRALHLHISGRAAFPAGGFRGGGWGLGGGYGDADRVRCG